MPSLAKSPELIKKIIRVYTMNSRDFDVFASLVNLAIFGLVSLVLLTLTLFAVATTAILSALIQGPITLLPFKYLFILTSVGLAFNMLPFNPITGFYNVLRMPVRAFNDLIESALIRRISVANAPRLKTFLLMLYATEAVIGIIGVYSLVIAPLQSVFLPFIGSALSTVFAFSLSAYNGFKMSSWVAERMANFDQSMRELRWRHDWRVQEEIPFDVRVENARRNQQQFQINPALQQQNRPAEQPQRSFSAVWYKALQTRDLKELLERLQLQYSSSFSRKLDFTQEMSETYTLIASNGDGFWKNVSDKRIKKLEDHQDNQEFCDPITLKFMRIPVIVTTAEHQHRFDLISLLHCLSAKGENPLNRQPIVDLQEIKFDEETYNKIQKVVDSAVAAEEIATVKRQLKSNTIAWIREIKAIREEEKLSSFFSQEQNAESAAAPTEPSADVPNAARKLQRRASFYL